MATASTTRTQRIIIWIIAVFLAVGSVGSFLIIVLGNQNAQADKDRFNQLYAQFQKESDDYQAKVDAQTKELSDKYYKDFNKYASRPAAFDKSSVKDLEKNDIVVGTGSALTAESTFYAYYIGWNPSGKVFDSSIKDGALVAPLEASPDGVIDGWSQGVDGMKVGGVRELTIPSDLAYGSTGHGDDIPADTPLKFIIMVIEAPDKITAPEPSDELINLYARIYGS